MLKFNNPAQKRQIFISETGRAFHRHCICQSPRRSTIEMLKNGYSNGKAGHIGGIKTVLRSRPTRHLASYTLLLLVTVAIWYLFARPMTVTLRAPAQSSVLIHKTDKEIDVALWPEERWYEGPRNESQLEKAALVMLVRYVSVMNTSIDGRNSELHPARSAMREVEDRFNKRFGYPWVFMNDEPFTDELPPFLAFLIVDLSS